MTYILGKDAKGEIKKAPNGLFCTSQPGLAGQVFDRHIRIVVPCETKTKPQDWKFLILGRGGLQNSLLKTLGKDCTFADLHQRKLIFESANSFRPSARYLYFHYVMAMLRVERGKKFDLFSAVRSVGCLSRNRKRALGNDITYPCISMHNKVCIRISYGKMVRRSSCKLVDVEQKTSQSVSQVRI